MKLLYTAVSWVAMIALAACGGVKSPDQSAVPTLTPSIAINQSTSTATLLPSPTVTITPVPSTQPPTAAVAPTETQPSNLTPTASAEPLSLPSSYYIQNISGHRQYFALGCEASAAKDWANYFGYDFNEFEFQYRLPLSDNPDYGFVGDVNGPWGQVPPYAYGVYAGPIADLLNAYDIPAQAYKGYTLDQLKSKIAADVPVIVWVIGNVVLGLPSQYTDSEGRTTIVAAYEHVVIVTGYNEGEIRYMNNGKFYDIPVDVFLTSWGVLGNMVVVDQ